MIILPQCRGWFSDGQVGRMFDESRSGRAGLKANETVFFGCFLLFFVSQLKTAFLWKYSLLIAELGSPNEQ